MAPLRALPRRLPRPTALRATTTPLSSLRPLSTTTARSIKEDAARDGHELDAKKNEQIDKQKQGKGEWHESLASAGEANIAADREGTQGKDHDEHMSDLQKETAGQSQAEHPQGKGN